MRDDDARARTIGEVMSGPLVTCAPDVPIRDVAALMVRHRIHAVVVQPDLYADAGDRAVISDLDLVGAVAADVDSTAAGAVAAGPLPMLAPDASPERAAQEMAEYAVTHLLVVPDDGAPVGIVSALDIAGVLAPAPEPPPSRAGGSAVAAPGDRLVVRGHRLGEPDRDAEILEARGPGGGPPFLVRWSDDGRVSLLYPGSDARVEHLGD